MKAQVDVLDEAKEEFEKRREEFYKDRDSNEELQNLQMQELAKLKHMVSSNRNCNFTPLVVVVRE